MVKSLKFFSILKHPFRPCSCLFYDKKNYFAIFGFEPSYDIDEDDLKRIYRSKMKRVHPDHNNNSKNDDRAQVLSTAYKTLRSSYDRAEYLLKLKGKDIAVQSMDPKFLMEMMALNEEVEQISHEKEAAQIKSEINSVGNFVASHETICVING
ncbi:hypothetical protein ACOME3_004331 [Neoechinorhynchus agilis]